MTDPHHSSPADICLLLRAHAEQRWLTEQLLPLLREFEPPRSIPEEQLGAALAYLEVVWIDAATRARETESAFSKLALPGTEPPPRCAHPSFEAEALRYHASVRALRLRLTKRVALITAAPAAHPGARHAHARGHRVRSAP